MTAVVLVTGASSGIGEATALRAAARGDHVALLARREAELTRVAESCQRAGAASTLVLPVDVADDSAVEAAVDRVVSTLGRLDVAVGDAGVIAFGDLGSVPVEVFDRVVVTNVLGQANLARHVLPHLREQGAGSIVLVGSVLGHLAVPGMTPYIVSKWGVRALHRQLQLETRDARGVRVGYVAPAGVDTPVYARGGNWSGTRWRPPPPVMQPDVVAEAILDVADGNRRRSQVGSLNDVMRLGFSLAPRVYDVLVGPLSRRVIRHGRADDSPGNVIEPGPGSGAQQP